MRCIVSLRMSDRMLLPTVFFVTYTICQSSETLNISRLFVYCDNNYYLCNKIIGQYGKQDDNKSISFSPHISPQPHSFFPFFLLFCLNLQGKVGKAAIKQ